MTACCRLLALGCVWWMSLIEARPADAQPPPLRLEEVLAGVTNQYPPLLAVLIERDVASGRLQSARAPFDFSVFTRIFSNPSGYYDSSTVDAGFEQFRQVFGSAPPASRPS